ncbi:RNA polymerase sigma factor [candidate division KSB1 bacterium]|nr:RNA polymerase sigma factor [candidate division KSB1 bacterium]
MEQPERELIYRFQMGDKSVFDKLVQQHDCQVLQIAYSLVGNLQDAQDVYQETWLRVFTHLHTFRFESEFRTWLLRIAINQALNHRKRRRRWQWLTLHISGKQTAATALEIPDPDANAERTVLNQELQQQILRSLDALSSQQRACLVLKHFQGLKIAEIATILNCAEGTVKNHLFRAAQKMQARLKAY